MASLEVELAENFFVNAKAGSEMDLPKRVEKQQKRSIGSAFGLTRSFHFEIIRPSTGIPTNT
jgi:hypothetical protein